MTKFTDLGLAQPILDALTAEGYSQPTPIQAMAIPHVLAGRDLLGIAATGTGKTAAFALPILQRLAENTERPARGTCRALVLAPTRELAAQIAASFRAYGRNMKLTSTVVVGGAAFGPQQKGLARGVDVLIATPGRLLDHMTRGTVRLDAASLLVLDEADHMLDLGFIPAVRKIVAKMHGKRQSLLFSATMPKEIRRLADDFLRDPQTVSATPPSTPAERIDQRLIHVETAGKSGVLADLLRERGNERVLVFTRTKRGADRVVRNLASQRIDAVAIHGNKSQGQRQRALNGFRTGDAPVLIATDIAARGIDVDGVGLVVNYDLPHVAETYVHRIGRTARAGAEGCAVSFCSRDERPQLGAIERLIQRRIPPLGGTVAASDPVAQTAVEEPVSERTRPRRDGRKRNGVARQQENRRQQGDKRPAAAARPHREGHPLEGMPFLQQRETDDGDRQDRQAPTRRRRRRKDRQDKSRAA